MKYYNKLLLLACLSGALGACADDEIAAFKTDKPESIVEYEYLNAYDALKTYVDRTANPHFKLGTGVTESDFLSKGLVYSLVCANYDEVTAGNAMKYSSVVGNNGSMNFSTVRDLVKVAKGAGITIYGHTLCWHSQQNNKYLNGIIADKVVESEHPSEPTLDPSVISNGDFEDGTITGWGGWGNSSSRAISAAGQGHNGGHALKITNPTVGSDHYFVQTSYNVAFKSGETYQLSFYVKGASAGIGQVVAQDANYAGDPFLDKSANKDFAITTDWKLIEMKATVTADRTLILLNTGKYEGDLYIDDISLCHVNTGGGGGIVTNEYAVQSDFENGLDNWGGWGNSSTREVVDGGGYNGTKGFKVVNPTATNSWSAQVAYDFASELVAGETYYLKLKIKGSVAGNIGAGFQKKSDYSGRGDFPAMSVTTGWKEILTSVTVSGENADRFLFNVGAYAGTLWMDDIEIYREVKGNTIPLTPEEKADTLTYALENWIKGMMEATEGYVKVWDVVNEPMSDWPDPTQLKSDPNHTDTENFYWQDYLGKDYARVAIKLARKYGGDNQVLFINDYGLEGSGNAKCKGLINMIAYWESDGVTRIDGIGTQMHVTYSLDPVKQQANEAAVISMLELLAHTGKLIKISELDMGIADVSGTNIKTIAVTLEQHKMMAEYYKFIVKKYFEIIPAAQRYGITHWSPADSPDNQNSFWRKGEPIGLWNLDYNRKPAYAGFAEGLSGK